MTLVLKVRQNKRKRNTVIALRVSFTRGVFHHSCFLKAFGDASEQTWMSWDTPLHFFQMRGGPHSDVKARHFLFCAGWWGRG